MTERFLNAYYFHFEPTGSDRIDAILEAVARAGKAYHHTDGWNEVSSDGLSYTQKIQNAANEAAMAQSTRESE